ncbi:DNA-binding protein [Virgibacillus soli]|nr:DNA-binding protein [Virgibacillus soli]
MITLAVNELIQDITCTKTYRLLWIDEGNVIAYLIDLDDEKALPFSITVIEISQGLIEGIYVKSDSFSVNSSNDYGELTEKEIELRNKNWDIIKNLARNEPNIYKKSERGPLINYIVSQKISTKKTIYKYLRKYWKNGKTINSLLPEYKNSGGRGKSKKNSTKKRGRPRTIDSVGINVNDETRNIFRKAIKKHYFTNKKNSLAYVYKMMIKEYYAEDVRYEDGVKHIVIKDQNSVPTLRQLRYWYKKEYDLQQTITAREGSKSFERNYRQILGSSSYESLGPGSLYQIDATIANVYLISSYNSDWIIGRPIIYFVVDVFSHMITGVYIGLEGPSWAGMMMALANATKDKKEFSKQYGIDISDDTWPSTYLPKNIVGDRGELEGYSVNHLINGLNVGVENNPSFRPDWKGIVEKLFDTSQEKIKPFLPGHVQPDYGERGAKDYRLDAKLTLEQYTKIIINFVLHYNKNFYMTDYLRDTDMIVDNIKPTPIELWKWGIKNRAGKLRKVSQETVKFYLMPKDKATITAKGIKYKKMLYSCETALKESWFAKARNDGSWKVDISYDTRNMNNIYLHTKNELLFETCSLLNHQERYQNKTIEEIEQLITNESMKHKEEGHVLLQEEVNFFSNIEAIVSEAIEETNQNQTTKISNAQKTKNIKSNRLNEKMLQRESEAFQLGRPDNKKADIIDFNTISLHDENSKKPSIKDLFNRRRGK